MGALKNLYPLVKKGGVIVFDEYNDHQHGEYKAIDEFFKEKKSNIKSFSWNKSSTAYYIKD